MENARRRQIAAIGTAARVVLGLSLLVSGVLGESIEPSREASAAEWQSLISA